MTLNDNIKIYVGVVTGTSGENIASSLSYNYIAVNTNNRSHIIESTQPARPRRPFDGDIEIAEPLAVGGAIMVYESNGQRTLILIDQEKYAVTECSEPGPGGRPIGMMQMMRGALTR